MAKNFPSTRISKLGGHNGPVHAVTYSAGLGQYILTGCSDREIRLFNPASSASPAAIQRYTAHAYAVLDLAVSGDNARFVSVGGDRVVFLWDVATAQTLRRWNDHSARCETVAIGGLGDEVIVSGSSDCTVKLWDGKSNSQKPLMTLSEARDSVSSVHVAGSDILTGSVDGHVRRYDLRTGKVMTDILGHPVTSVTATKRNDSYLVSTLDSRLRLMDNTDGKLLKAFSAPDAFINDTYRARSTFLKGDAIVIAGSENGSVLAWDILTGAVVGRAFHCEPQLKESDAERGSNTRPNAPKPANKRDVISSVAACSARQEWCSAGGDGNVVVWGP